MIKNVDYWEEIVKNPTSPYKKLFREEERFLLLHIKRGSKVLDVGCGYGRIIKVISSITNDIVGVDNDLGAIEKGKKHKFNIIYGDVFGLPFENRFFDYEVLTMTLVNFANNKIKALQEMGRTLKDNGKIIISVYSEDALPARLDMYKIINAPIRKIEGTKVIFDKNIGANVSEQFSKKDIEVLVEKSGMKISDYRKIDKIAYIFVLEKR